MRRAAPSRWARSGESTRRCWASSVTSAESSAASRSLASTRRARSSSRSAARSWWWAAPRPRRSPASGRTGYAGPLLVDPSILTFKAAGLAYGTARTYDLRAVPRAVVALLAGFRQGARRGRVFQQGGTFVLGPGEKGRFEGRDRFPGDHPSMEDVRAALS